MAFRRANRSLARRQRCLCYHLCTESKVWRDSHLYMNEIIIICSNDNMIKADDTLKWLESNPICTITLTTRRRRCYFLVACHPPQLPLYRQSGLDRSDGGTVALVSGKCRSASVVLRQRTPLDAASPSAVHWSSMCRVAPIDYSVSRY